MKLLVTGSGGFIGKNLIAALKNRGYEDILEYDRDTDPGLLKEYASECDFVFHLAGVNRPKEEKEFMEGNADLTRALTEALEAAGSPAPVLMSSSIQALLDNPYGVSKRAGEEVVFDHCRRMGARALVYRLPNVFGKWSRPSYNSVVATFCHNIARQESIQINDENVMMRLVYIDDVAEEFIAAMEGGGTPLGECFIYGSAAEGRSDKRSVREEKSLAGDEPERYMGVARVHEVKLGTIARLIRSFFDSRASLSVPDMSDPFTSALYSTYLSFLPTDSFAYELKMNCDNRGSFTEFLRDPSAGQVSVNVSLPGITKGQHWHHSKNEKFLVVKGEGLIRFRRIDDTEIIEYRVSGKKLTVVDIPTGYTHSIVNVGDEEMVTVMWANEPFDPEHPDTWRMEV